MSRSSTTPIVGAVTAKVRKIRPQYEEDGFEVIERPGPEHFPFDIGPFAHHPPAMLARRGGVNRVVEVREEVRATGRLADQVGDHRAHPEWHFYLTSCDDVVPEDAPGIQGDPPAWPRLRRAALEAIAMGKPLWPPAQLLSAWPPLEGVLRRIAVDAAIPVDLLSAETLIATLHDRGLIPAAAHDALTAAHEIHRLVRHGFGVPDAEAMEAARTVSVWLSALFPASIERAA